VRDRTYHDLRGTCVVRFAKAGSKVLDIMAITGHSLGDVKTIFETHYMLLDEELGDRAVTQREMSAVFPTDLAPNGRSILPASATSRMRWRTAQLPSQQCSQLPPNWPRSVRPPFLMSERCFAYLSMR
jgi:hypothetical protein